jgi:nicotinamide N-methyltransferase
LWGKDVDSLLALLDPAKSAKFDIIILADVLFNHACNQDLVKTCRECISQDGQVLVSFSHHKPKLREKDLHFFTMAEESGFKVEHIFSENRGTMFPEDNEIYGEEEIRSMVHFYVLKL